MQQQVESGPAQGDSERQVLDIVRALALEVGGPRAAGAVSPQSSLDREIGLGSLERVEPLMRLESAFGRELGDEVLLLDTPRELADALAAAPVRAAPAITRAHWLAPSLVDSTGWTTLTEALVARAAGEPTRIHAYLEGEREATGRTRSLTFGELRDAATRIAAALAARGVSRGDRVAIMLPTGSDYLTTFMGVLTLGAVAVPLYPPMRTQRIAEFLQRQARIVANAGARLLISVQEAVPVARLLRHHAPDLSAITTPQALAAEAPSDAAPATSSAAGDPALIQYTSGSTGDPKGVLLSHANLMANIRAIAVGLELKPTDVAVSWLPLYHDMGLIGSWLTALVHGIPITYSRPSPFLRGRSDGYGRFISTAQLCPEHRTSPTSSARGGFARTTSRASTSRPGVARSADLSP